MYLKTIVMKPAQNSSFMTFLHRDLMPYAPRLFENKIWLIQFLKFF